MVRLLPYKQMMWLLNKPSVVVKIYAKLSSYKKVKIRGNSG